MTALTGRTGSRAVWGEAVVLRRGLVLQGLLGSSPGGCWQDGAQFRAGLVLVLPVSVLPGAGCPHCGLADLCTHPVVATGSVAI